MAARSEGQGQSSHDAFDAATQHAVQTMLSRGLTDSASWITDMLTGADEALLRTPFEDDAALKPPRGFRPTSATGRSSPSSSGTAETSTIERDTDCADHAPPSVAVLHARALLAKQEYRRCMHAVRRETSDEAVFLRHYAWYLDGERHATLGGDANGEMHSANGLSTYDGSCPPSDVAPALRKNPYLPDLLRTLGELVVTTVDAAGLKASGKLGDSDARQGQRRFHDGTSSAPAGAARLSGERTPLATLAGRGSLEERVGSGTYSVLPGGATHVLHGQGSSSAVEPQQLQFHDDPFLCWLFGVVASRSGRPELALQALAAAVTLQPLLWCAWADLAKLVQSEAMLAEIARALRPECVAFPWTVVAFQAVVRQTLQAHNAARMDIDRLQETFPGAAFVQQLRAKVYADTKDYEAAKDAYLRLRALDNFRLQGMDDFSNVLFVLNDRRGLSALAIDCFTVDPFRVESNCVAGNLYALIGQHERSLLHFRRAVTIDPSCVSAWTLLGHEFLEVRNTAASVEAYRTAITIDDRDYRAWYGLGQIYELLQLYPYALHYYRQTTTMRPHDGRMWVAAAGCLEKLLRLPEAVACLEHAAACEDPASDGYTATVLRAAQQAQAIDADRAAALYRKLLESPRCKPDEAIDAHVFLVQYVSETCTSLLRGQQTSHRPNAHAGARAPSFDPVEGVYSDGGAQRSLRPEGRPSVAARRELVATLLQEAAEWLHQLELGLGEGAPRVQRARQWYDRAQGLYSSANAS